MIAAMLLMAGAVHGEPILNGGLQQTACVPDYAKKETARIGNLNANLFAAEQLDIEVADAKKMVASKLRATDKQWIGKVGELGTLVITRAGSDGAVGTLNVDGRTWEWMPQCGGTVLYEVEPVLFEEPSTPPAASRPPDFEEPETRGVTNVDMLVLYTQSAATKWTEPTLLAKIDTAIANSNLWMEQSGATVTLTSVATIPSPIQESGSGIAQTTENLRMSPEVAALRAKYYADIVMLITNDDGNGYAGWAKLYWSWNSTGMTSVEAHAVTISSYLGGFTFAHESGHMIGLDHNRESAGSTAPGYHYGYRVCLSGSGFRDIMSYSCSSVPQIAYFSNPTLTYNGQPLGVEYAKDPAKGSETYRSLNENAPKVTSIRNPPSPTEPPTQPPPSQPAPSAPVNLLITKSGTSAILTWGYADNFATSGVIQRAKKNKGGKWSGYAEVGTVNAPTNSYTDRPSRGTYRYTVTARNASGSSSAAGPVIVTL